MKTGTSVGVSLALLLALGLAAAAHADGVAAARQVAGAFASGDAEHLKSVLSADRRTYVSLPGFASAEGHFGSVQVYYIFSEIFEHYGTRGASMQEPEQQGDKTHARIRWVFTTSDGDAEESAVINVTLEATSDGWALTDIRSSSSRR